MDDYAAIIGASEIYVDTCVLLKLDFDEGPSSNVARMIFSLTTNKNVFTSKVASGEFIGALGRKESKEKKIDTVDYLLTYRRLMVDLEMKRVNEVEPIADRFKFQKLAETLSGHYPELKG
jgi:predicted nucleic acid-binding protein